MSRGLGSPSAKRSGFRPGQILFATFSRANGIHVSKPSNIRAVIKLLFTTRNVSEGWNCVVLRHTSLTDASGYD